MSYIKTQWKTGDVITSEKLNNIEDGISRTNAIELDLGTTSDNIGKSFNEIEDGLLSGCLFYYKKYDNTGYELRKIDVVALGYDPTITDAYACSLNMWSVESDTPLHILCISNDPDAPMGLDNK